jgi:uncharacterized membrane protein
MNHQSTSVSWPFIVKVFNSFWISHASAFSYKLQLFVGYTFVLLAIVEVADYFYSDEISASMQHIQLISGYLILAIYLLISGYSIKWVFNNSSWDEGYEQNISFIYKALYTLIIILFCFALYLIFSNKWN